MKYRKFWIILAVLLLSGIVTASEANAQLTNMEQLGKSIFFDQNLSIEMDQSCASCHAPEVGWTGPESGINAAGAVYEGSINGQFGDRRPPSSAYATPSPILYYELKDKKPALFTGGNFWDGRATGEKLGNPAADQAQGPFLNPKEQALTDSACVVYRVCEADYLISLEHVWGGACEINWPENIENVCTSEDGVVDLGNGDRVKSDTAFDNIALSIAAYEASPEVNAFTSKWDYTKKGKTKLSNEERKGFNLFKGKGRCAGCHITKGKQPLFTDYTFDNLGVPKNPENPVYDDNTNFVDWGLGGFLETRVDDYIEFAPDNYGKQKVPTLRNVDLRPSKDFVKAYGHNGYFKSLKGIVHFYNTRDVKEQCEGLKTEAEALESNCWPAPEVAANVNMVELGNLGLTEEEEYAIVAFMMTLSDGYKP